MDASTHNTSTGHDTALAAVKNTIQRQSRELVSSGRLTQQDLFFIRPDVAQRAIVFLKA